MNSVTVYTTTTCPYCTMVKKYLREQNVPFTEVNVGENPEAMQKVVNATGQMGVPQTEIDGQWVVGFDPDTIMKVLKTA